MSVISSEIEKIELKSSDKILFFGIGNIGRQDDGLGIRLIEKLWTIKLPDHIACEANYQLNVEDALLISDFDVVIFVDAAFSSESNAPFCVRAVEASPEITFTTHAMSIGSVVALCAELYRKNPKVYLLMIPGYEWNIQDGLTEAASHNLEKAVEVLLYHLQSHRLSGCDGRL